MGTKASFDELTKIITVTLAPVDNEIYLDVKADLYSDGKEDWVANENLRKFVFPIVAVGGNALPGSKALGATFFLASDWKIRPYEANHKLTVNGNLYAVDGSDPFLDTIGVYTVRIIQQVSSLVDSTVVQLSEIEYASFGGGVSIDINSSNTGIQYPVGNQAFPVNNLADAVAIANLSTRGFHTLFINKSMTLDGSVNIEGFNIIGRSRVITCVTINPAVSCDGVGVENCKITGTLDGNVRIDNCSVCDLLYVYGHILNSALYGTITLAGSKDGYIANCSILDVNSIPTIDMGGSGQNVFFADWSGGIKFRNMTGDNKIGVHMDGGRVYLESTISAGFAGITGVGELVDGSTGTCMVVTNGLLNKTTVAAAVWGDSLTGYSPGEAGDALQSLVYGKEVILDTANGQAGTSSPIGTRAHPSNNLTDTLAICAANNLVRIMTRSNVTIEAGHNVDGISIETHGILGTDIVLQAGCSANKTTIRYANISGVIANGDLLFVESCSVGNLENFTGIMNVATFGEGCEISLGLWANFINCHCGGEPTNEPEVSIGAASLTVVNYSGNVKFTNKTGTNRTAASFLAGNVSIASSCVLGKIQILGTGEVDKDDSGPNCHVDVDAALTNEYIADHVLDELVAEHVVDGSLSNIVQNIQDGVLRTLGLDQENQYTDQMTYTATGELLTARVRIYNQAVSVGTDVDILATYQITATYTSSDMLTYKAVRV